MKVISTGFPEGYDRSGGNGRRPGHWKIAGLAAAAVLLLAVIAVPVFARQPAQADAAGEPPQAAADAEPAAAPCTEPVPAAADGVLVFDGPSVSSAQSPVAGSVNRMSDGWDGTGTAAGAQETAGQLPVTEEPAPDGDADDVALAMADNRHRGDAEQAAGQDGAQETAAEGASETQAAPAAVKEPEPKIVYVYIEKEPEPAQEQEPASEEAAEPDDGPPDWLFGGEPEPEPAPEWLLTTLDKAMWNNPYDGGPLCQKGWAEIPCAVTDGTRAYVQLDTTVAWLTQGDLLGFVGNSIRYCGADWFTIVGIDGWGIQFPGCNTDFAVYGPLDEYGEVTEPAYYIFLDENGYYAVASI